MAKFYDIVNGNFIERKSRPKGQTSIENAEAISRAKAERERDLRRDAEERAKKHALSWRYDEAETRAQLKAGTYEVEPDRLYEDYLRWLNDASIITLREQSTGEAVRKLAPKRGNPAYARIYRERLTDLEAMLDGLTFNEPMGGRGLYQRCRAMLVTLTYDQKKITCQDAWASISGEIAKFKILFKRAIGASSLASIAVKEGTQSGYPAPHLFIVIDQPMICFKHRDRKGVYRWRVQSTRILDAIKRSWPHGFVDIQAVIDGEVRDGDRKRSVCAYLFKYLTKAVNVSKATETASDAKNKALGLRTFAWQKLYRLRPLHVAAAFRRLRLDTDLRESQQPPTGTLWAYHSSARCKLTEYIQILSSPPPPLARPWPLGHGANVKPAGFGA